MPKPRLAVELADVEKRAASCPATYVIPAREERESLWPGDLVKVVVVAVGPRSCSEWIWVRVGPLQVGQVRYQGTVVSFPITTGLQSGDELEFGPEHVSDVYRTSDAETNIDRRIN